MKIKVEMEMEIDGKVFNLTDGYEREWFKNEVMNGKTLVLHSNEIGGAVSDSITALTWEII